MRRFVVAFLLLASPALGQEAPPRDDFAAWAKERIVQLEGQVEALKERVDALTEQAKPVIRDMRQKFEEERPGLEAAGRSFWEKVKTAAAAIREDVQNLFDRRG